MKRVLLISLLLTGCASAPLIDPKASKTPGNYYADQMECERIAEGISYPAEMAKAGALQAVLSAFMGAALAGNNMSAVQGAQIGAVSGALVGTGTGAYNAYSGRQKVVLKCLEGRGYKVLN